MNTLLGYSYQNGGQVSKKLKPIPKDNPGLAKLPQEVRNRMGYMQEGGSVSPALARLLRKRAKYDSQQAYEEALREEAKNKERASLFGGFGSLAGSLLLPALTGITGGAALPFIAALGAAGGKKIGASSGYQGRLDLNPLNAADYKDYSRIMDDEDLIYGSDAFRGLESSARDYTRSGMEQDAIVSGLKTGLMAGFGGSDSIYGKAGSVNLLKEGAGQRFSDLFKQQAMAKTVEPLTVTEAANEEALRSLTSGTGGYNAGSILDYITPTAQDTANIYESAGNVNPFLEQPLFSANTVASNPVSNQLNTGFINDANNYANNELSDYLSNRYNIY